MVVVAGGLALRVLGARGDLWLDEIWSIELARMAGSAGAVFTLHHDNNHYLNTLWLLLLGYDVGSLPARMLSVASGAATVALAAAADPRDRLRSLAWAFLLAFSYSMIHYGSEARGYAPAMLFAVGGYVAMERLLESGRAAWAAAVAACGVLGVLSHLTFAYVLLALIAWGAAVARRGPRRPGQPTALALAFVPPVAALALLWAVDLRSLEIGGGPPYSLLDAATTILRVTLGTPRGLAGLLGVAALALVAGSFVRLVRQRDLRWVFFATVVVLAPAAMLAFSRSAYLAPRYFLLCMPFVLWLVADGLAWLWRYGKAGAAGAAVLALLFLAGSAYHTERLLRLGRGQYRAALEFIVRSEPGPVATVGSDNDFRNPTVIRRYFPDVPGFARFRYVQSPEWVVVKPGWALAHRFEDDPEPDRIVLDPEGGRYDLVRVFPHAGLSGWDWYVYRRAPQAIGR